MAKKKCPDCGREIDDQYIRCRDCSLKVRQATQATNDDICRALGAINNNLYHLIKIEEFMMRQKHGYYFVWSKNTGKDKADFVLKPVDDSTGY